MSTSAAYTNIQAKRIIGHTDLGQNLLDYLKDSIKENSKITWKNPSVQASQLTMNGSGTNEITLSGGPYAVDGLGNVVDPISSDGHPFLFENLNAIDYYIALKHILIPSGIRVNPRNGEVYYDAWKDEIGESAQPDAVSDEGGNIKFTVNSVTEASVDNSGRKVAVYMNTPAEGATTEAIAIEVLTVAYSAGNNTITTTGTLGQTTVSTNPADYTVALIGPTVKKNTDLRGVSSYVFIGIATGNGATPATFNHDDQTVTDTSLSDLSHITRIASNGRLKIDVTPLSTESGENQIQSRDTSGAVVFSVDEAGNVVIEGNLSVTGTTTQEDVVQVNSNETITDNLTAGDAATDTHAIKGTWTHYNAAGTSKYFEIDGASGRVGFGGAPDGTYALKVWAASVWAGDLDPAANNTYDLGGANRWNNVYAESGRFDRLFLSGLVGDGVGSSLLPVTDQALSIGTAGRRFSLVHSMVLQADSYLTVNGYIALNGYISPSGVEPAIRSHLDATYDLGTATYRWKDIYLSGAVNAGTGSFSGALGAGAGTFAGHVLPSADSTYDLGSNAVRWATLYVDDLVTTTPITPSLSAIDEDIMPLTTNTYNIGSNALRWNEVYCKYLFVSADLAAAATEIRLTNEGDSNQNTEIWVETRQTNRYGGRITFGRENALSWLSTGTNADGFISFSPVLNGTLGEAARFTSTKRFGVGTTDPASLVHISNDGTHGSVAASFEVTGDGTTTSVMRFGNDIFCRYQQFVNAGSGANDYCSFERYRTRAAEAKLVPGDIISLDVYYARRIDSSSFSGAVVINVKVDPDANATYGNGVPGHYSIWTNDGTQFHANSSAGFERFTIRPIAQGSTRIGVGINQTAPTSNIHVSGDGSGSAEVGIIDNEANSCTLLFKTYSSGSAQHRPAFGFYRSRGTRAAPADTNNGDYLGSILSAGYFSGGYKSTAAIYFSQTGAAAAQTPGDIQFWTNNSVSTALRSKIRSSGTLYIGDPSGISIGKDDDVEGAINIHRASALAPTIQALGYQNNSAPGGQWSCYKSRGAAVDSLVATVNGDTMGSFKFYGVNTSAAWANNAEMRVEQEGTGGATYIPARFVWKTGTDAAAPTDKMVLDKDGTLFLGDQMTAPASLAGAGRLFVSGLQGPTVWNDGPSYNRIASFGALSTDFCYYSFIRGRGTAASPSALSSNDTVGEMRFYAHDGTDFNECAHIAGVFFGSHGTTYSEGELRFSTSTTSGKADRMKITSSGQVRIGSILDAQPAETSTWGQLSVNSTNGFMNWASGAYSYVRNLAYSNTSVHVPMYQFLKARGTSDTPTATGVNDELGALRWYCWDGNSWNPAAAISSVQAAAHGTSYTPGRLEFQVADTAGLDTVGAFHSSGAFTVGHIADPGVSGSIDQRGTGAITHSIRRYSADASGVALNLMKSRSATLGTLSTTSDNDTLGLIDFYGVDTSNAQQVATRIFCAQGGTATASAVPGEFHVYVSSAGTLTRRFSIYGTSTDFYESNFSIAKGASDAVGVRIGPTSPTNGVMRFLANDSNANYIQSGTTTASNSPQDLWFTSYNGTEKALYMLSNGSGNSYTLATGGETAPDVGQGGLCLKIDNETSWQVALSLKYTGMNNGSGNSTYDTDTFLQIKEDSKTDGGVNFYSVCASGKTSGAFRLLGVTGEQSGTQPTSYTTSTDGTIILSAAKQTGGPGWGPFTGDFHPLVTIENGTDAKHIFAADGDYYNDSNIHSSFDKEQDALAVSGLKSVLTNKFNEVAQYNKEKFQELGIMSGDFVSNNGVRALMMGAIEEMYLVMNKLLEKQGLSYEDIRKEIRAQ